MLENAEPEFMQTMCRFGSEQCIHKCATAEYDNADLSLLSNANARVHNDVDHRAMEASSDPAGAGPVGDVSKDPPDQRPCVNDVDTLRRPPTCQMRE